VAALDDPAVGTQPAAAAAVAGPAAELLLGCVLDMGLKMSAILPHERYNFLRMAVRAFSCMLLV
jgi:hypothetical protein